MIRIGYHLGTRKSPLKENFRVNARRLSSPALAPDSFFIWSWKKEERKKIPRLSSDCDVYQELSHLFEKVYESEIKSWISIGKKVYQFLLDGLFVWTRLNLKEIRYLMFIYIFRKYLKFWLQALKTTDMVLKMLNLLLFC